MRFIRFVMWLYILVVLGVFVLAFVMAAFVDVQTGAQILRNGLYVLIAVPVQVLIQVICEALPYSGISSSNLLGLMIFLFFLYLVWHYLVAPIARFALRKGEGGGAKSH